MQPEFRTFAVREPNQNLLHSAFLIEQVCLVVAIQVILINLLSRIFAPIDHLLPAGLLHMRVSSASAALCATVALFLTETARSKRFRRIGQFLGAATALLAASAIWASVSQREVSSNGNQLVSEHGSLPASCFAFLLLGVAILLIRSHDSLWSHLADAIASCLAFLVLVLTSELLLGLANVPGSSIAGPLKLPTLACLALLTLAVIIRRAEYGIFSVFLGSEMDGRVARILAPVLLTLPFLRELGRARLLDTHLVPTHYATAVLTSAATVVSFVLLLILSRLISNMQTEIHQLNLRDELTGLYNYRGFNLFAEQAFRVARRSRRPFGVLFVDMDNLKMINDELGHSVGSISLIETAKLLTATFRETDVIGRLGGDEFVVGGQFDRHEISTAMERLRAAAAAKTDLSGRRFSISLSMGYASTEHASADTLKSVVARADKAMYKEKREKKRAAG